MRSLRALIQNDAGAAAAEMMMVTPLLVALMFGAAELGNYFLTEHAVIKQVRDGARYASRLTIADDFVCTAGSDLSDIFKDGDASGNILNVTKTGSVDGSASGRFPAAFWAACAGSPAPVSVSIRCVDKSDYGGIYTSLADDIPVVTVHANVAYPSLFGTLGFGTSTLCLRAETEAAVAGL